MRILFPSAAHVLTDHLPHGEGLIAHELLTRLARRGHRVVALTDSVQLRLEPEYSALEIEPGRHPSLRPALRARRVSRRLRALQEDFDIAHWLFPQDFHEQAFANVGHMPTVIGPLVAPWPSPNVPLRHRPLGAHVRTVLSPWFESRFRRVSGHASLLLATPAAAGVLGAHNRARAKVLPFPIDTQKWSVAPLPRQPTVLFVGRLSPAKNPLALLDAFERIDASRGWRLVIAGTGELASTVHTRVNSPMLRGRVEYVGAVDHDEIPRLVAASSVICLPSNHEPFGRTILEAMAGGRAVVAGLGGGPDHLVKGDEGGAQVDGTDPAQIALALERLLGDADLLSRIGLANRRRAVAEFDYAPVLDTLEAVYRRALPRRRITMDLGGAS